MKILLLGSFASQALINNNPDYGLDSYRTTEFLLKGLADCDEVTTFTITLPDVGSYPKFPQVFIHGERDYAKDIVYLPLLNIKYIKQFWIMAALYYNMMKFIIRSKEAVYVICPYMVLHHVVPFYLIKKTFPHKVKTCAIVPDIFSPQEGRKLTITEKLYRLSDSFVLYTTQMATFLGINDRKYIIMESIINKDILSINDKENSFDKSRKTVVYTGGLNRNHGVLKLVEVMNYLKNEDFELVITGRGDLLDELRKASINDTRIRVLGTVPKNEVFKLQMDADVLISPRSNTDCPEISKYMFPSKVMEYMLTGNPVVLCKMDGIPDDYYKYVFCSEDGSAESLSKVLLYVLTKTKEERHTLGKAAQQYIINNKDCRVQAKRVLALLKEV